VLAATLFAHDLATLGVHALAGLGDDGADVGGCGLTAGRSGLLVAGSAWFAEQAGKRCDGFEQQCVNAGLLIGGALGVELGDRSAVLGLGGELTHPCGDRGVDPCGDRGVDVSRAVVSRG